MDIRFLLPEILFALAALPLLWLLPRRLTDWRYGALRSLVFALLILALARPVMTSSFTQGHRVAILDQSESLSPAQRAEGRAAVARLGLDEDATLVVIGGDLEAEAAEFPIARLIHLDSEASPLGDALAVAALEIPDGAGGRIDLISDGLATDRDWGPVVQSLVARGVAVNTVDLSGGAPDAYPAAVRALWPLRAGQTADLAVDVIGAGEDLEVRLTGPEGEIASSGRFGSDGRTNVSLQFEAPETDFLTVTATVAGGDDADPDNNMLTTTLAVQAPLRILYLGGRQQGGADRLAELLGAGFEVVDGAARDLAGDVDPEDYDLVMIDDRPAAEISEALQQRIADATRDRGVGLMMAGGRAAFASGGYDRTPIADALPVELRQRESRETPSVALVVIIDTSGSMSGQPIELAKQVARLTVRRLSKQDKVGIVEFYGGRQWAAPLQSAENRVGIERAIARMQALGGTVLYPAIEEAYYGLQNVDARYKHILVITDAGIEAADFEPLVRQAAASGVTLSTILVGSSGYDPTMFDLASWGGGRFYTVADGFSLVDVDLKQPAVTKLPAWRPGDIELTAEGPARWWTDGTAPALPALSGYVETTARPEADVLVEAAAGAPVLANWRYGLGGVTVLMTEPLGDGAARWAEWDGYGAFLGRLVTLTASDQPPFDFTLVRAGGALRLTAQRLALDAELRPEAELTAGENARPLDFRERAPGVFEAEFDLDPGMEARIAAGAAGWAQRTRLVSPAHEDVAAETQVDPARALDLTRLAEVTGGWADGGPRADVAPQTTGFSITPLRAWFALAALLVFLTELVYRRWPRGGGLGASR